MRRSSACLLLVFVCSVAGADPLDSARSLFAEGRYDEAVEAFRDAAEAIRDTDPDTAGAAWNNACVIQTRTGHLPEALADCREALRVRRLVGDAHRLGRTLNNLGLVQQHLGEYEIAAGHFEEALELNRAADDVEGQAINLANLGVVWTEAGRYATALDFHGRVIALAAEHDEDTWARRQQRLARMNQAVVLEKLGAYREALDLYKQILPETSELDPARWAAFSLNLGVVYRNLGDPISAQRHFETARRTYETLGDTSALSNVQLDLALVHHLNLDQPVEAETAYREALRLAEESGDRPEEIRDLCYLGRFLLDTGRYDEAQATFRRALRIAEESDSAEGRWTSFEGLGRIAAARGDLHEALLGLREAMAEIERTRSHLVRGALRAEFFGQKRPVYAAAVEVLYRLSLEEPLAGHDAEAFAVAQRAKARVLLDSLGPDALRGEPLDAAGVAERVRAGILLEYFVGENHLFRWDIDRSGLTLHALGPPGPTLEAVAAIHRHLSTRTEPPPALLRDLSDTLLRDLREPQKNIGRVRIAPDARLHYLPFEILPLPGGADRPLITAFDVSYLPTGSALAWLDPGITEGDLTVLALGAPVSDTGSEEPSEAALWASRFDLEALPAATDELAGLRNWLPGKSAIRTGANATEHEFRRMVASGARVVHLASHAVVDERHGRGTAILMTPDDDSDGLLFPDEIVTLDYPVGLTVLAACRTALGSDQDGDALSSLTGSFLAAGSSAVVATLWDVGDRATGAFMEQFYHQLRRGLTPAAALREAKRRLLADPDWDDRHVWAAYVLVGESDRIVSPPVGRWAFVVVLLAAACGLGTWLVFRSRPA